MHYLKLRVAINGEPIHTIHVLEHEKPIDRQWVVDVLAAQNVTEPDFFGPPRAYTPVEMEPLDQDEFDELYKRATTIPGNTTLITNLTTNEARLVQVPKHAPFNTNEFPAWNHYFRGYEERGAK
jgi:hypothetical protein